MTSDRETLALAERVIGIVTEGSFSATYKFALFTAILDLCIERASAQGEPPSVLTTRQIAEKVVELYWNHATPYEGGAVLRQGGNTRDQQAEILRRIVADRERLAGGQEDTLFRVKATHAAPYERLVRFVEWKLIEWPIPRLQVLGGSEDRFLYDYAWTQAVRKAEVSAYQDGRPSGFDNRLLLKPDVPESLVRLNGVLRPLFQREWALMVAAMNGLPEARLQTFLFGADRIQLNAIRDPLRELQEGCCFYCGRKLGRAVAVDHFIPWSRYADNGLDNLVVADETCNQSKRDYLAAADHVVRWNERNASRAADLDEIARGQLWLREPGRTRAVAVAMYSRVPDGSRLWRGRAEFVPHERAQVLRILTESSGQLPRTTGSQAGR